MMFTEAEQEFLRSQRLARVATVGPTGWPHVVPVMYKLRNITAEPRSALVVDGSPKRGVSVQGRAEVIGHERARLTPDRKFSWGL